MSDKIIAVEVVLTRPLIKRGEPQLDMTRWEVSVRTVEQARFKREKGLYYSAASSKNALDCAVQHLKRVGKDRHSFIGCAESPSLAGWVLLFKLETAEPNRDHHLMQYDGGGWKSLPGTIRNTPDGRDGFSRNDT